MNEHAFIVFWPTKRKELVGEEAPNPRAKLHTLFSLVEKLRVLILGERDISSLAVR